MQALIEIQMESDAFRQAPASELGRILRLLARRVETEGTDTAALRDSDGKTVGSFRLTSE